MSQIKLGGNHCLPYLKFSSWVQFLFSHNLWHHLCGLEQPNESMCKKVWSQFWDRYKKIHPTHPVFHRGLDMSRVCALILHGDEGRTAKKSAILIVSLHSILGYGLRTATNARNDIHKLNYKASTWVTRFLLGVLPKSLYQYDAGLSDEEGGSEDENDEDDIDGDVVESLLQFISNDLAMLYNDGFINPFTGEKHYFVVLNIAGDWPWLQKSGHLTRTFMNAAKHKGSVSGTGICHMCLADRSGYEWENFEQDVPAWLPSVNIESPFRKEPALLSIPHDGGNQPQFWSWDLFHTYHLGCAKTFLATAIVLLAMSEACEGSIENRISYVNQLFQQWCQSHNFRPRLRKITKEILGWKSTTTFPEGSWSKGSTSRILAKWFLHECEQNISKVRNNRLLEVAFSAAKYVENFLKGIYSYEVFIPKQNGKYLAEQGLTFLKLYGRGAFMSWKEGKALFMMRPNFHRLHHILIDMRTKSNTENIQYIISPLTTSTQADEDYIGRPSRVSRKVSVRRVVSRTIERSLIAIRAAYSKAGLLIEDRWVRRFWIWNILKKHFLMEI